VDQETEHTFSQESGKGFCKGESGDASVLLGTGQGYCGEESRESMGVVGL